MADEQNVDQEITEQTTATNGDASSAPAEPQDKMDQSIGRTGSGLMGRWSRRKSLTNLVEVV